MMRFMVCSSVFKFFEIKKPVLKKDGLAAVLPPLFAACSRKTASLSTTYSRHYNG